MTNRTKRMKEFELLIAHALSAARALSAAPACARIDGPTSRL
jgi:hypothetical protein